MTDRWDRGQMNAPLLLTLQTQMTSPIKMTYFQERERLIWVIGTLCTYLIRLIVVYPVFCMFSEVILGCGSFLEGKYELPTPFCPSLSNHDDKKQETR